jgi:Zn-dependent alcohol dehydrogenase
MKVKAAVLRQVGQPVPYAVSQPLVIETVELAPPGTGEICVCVLAAGLCHSDLSVINGSRPRTMPIVLGHEATGEIVELGAGVEGFRVGDRVVFCFVPNCGRCGPCASGRASLCEPGALANAAGTLLGGGRRWLDAQGVTMQHHLGVSGFAEFTVVSAHSAVVNTAKVSAGESVAVFGLGGVGLAALLGARAAGANPIIAVDVAAHKFALARELGASHCVDARGADAIDSVRELSHGGVQYAIESVGSEQVLAQAYAATRRGGTTVTVGLPAPDRMLTVPAFHLVVEEHTIKGSFMGSSVPSRDVPRFIALYRAGLLPVDRLLTHRLRLDEMNTGFDRLDRAEAIRQVVLF